MRPFDLVYRACRGPKRRRCRFVGIHLLALATGVLLFWGFHPKSAELMVRLGGKPALLLSTVSDSSCEGCHRKLDPGLYSQWRGSAHARANVGCAGCHGPDHEAVFAVKGRVSAGTCSTCHEQVVAEFAASGHATTEADAKANARFLAQSEAMQVEGCMGCHAIGRRFGDGSVGGCNKCHPGHAFSSAVAREPEACEVCHVGPDHPQMEAYRTSVHGVLYGLNRDPAEAPTCVTCHMPGGTHGSVSNLTLGHIASGATLDDDLSPNVPMRRITREEMAENRKRMLDACGPCHTTRFARESLRRADEVKRDADTVVAEARAVIQALYDEGVLDPMPGDRLPHPVSGHALVLGGDQLYEGTSAIEGMFFRMFKFYHSTTFKSAYHQSPDYTHWKGNAFLKMTLDDIRSEATRLRQLATARGTGG